VIERIFGNSLSLLAVTVCGEQTDGKFRIQLHCREIVAGFIVRRGKGIAAVSPHLLSYYDRRRVHEKNHPDKSVLAVPGE
jgi:hypothetical protein